MSSSSGNPRTFDYEFNLDINLDGPRYNFLVFPRAPHSPGQAAMASQNIFAMFLDPEPLSIGDHISTAPLPVSDLKPAGIINQGGVLLALCLESPSGEVINAAFELTGFPGNILYRGSYRGIDRASGTATMLGHPNALAQIGNAADSSDMMVASLPPGFRKVDLEIRYTDTDPPENELLATLEQSEHEWMMIIFPLEYPAVIGHVQPGFVSTQPPLKFIEVVQDSVLGTTHRVGQF